MHVNGGSVLLVVKRNKRQFLQAFQKPLPHKLRLNIMGYEKTLANNLSEILRVGTKDEIREFQ